jgi:hypothetical protein
MDINVRIYRALDLTEPNAMPPFLPAPSLNSSAPVPAPIHSLVMSRQERRLSTASFAAIGVGAGVAELLVLLLFRILCIEILKRRTSVRTRITQITK